MIELTTRELFVIVLFCWDCFLFGVIHGILFKEEGK